MLEWDEGLVLFCCLDEASGRRSAGDGESDLFIGCPFVAGANTVVNGGN